MYAIRALILLLLTCSALHGFGQQQPVKQNDTVLLRIDSLQAAIVTATQRPRMKGDTLEYNTEHMLMRPNALVEELLRRLPGLQVSPDGTITYNGEKIEHLLVDGEDIFASSPTLITRNLNAGKIARVEILDRKTDQAIFSGIDDGTRIKTLNLVLKESAKDGYFGRADAGGNTDGYYNANGVLAGFKNKEQFTALGLASNTGIVGFSNKEGNASINFQNADVTGDPLGASAGAGIPRFTAGALHYANTWDSRRDHLMANYQYSHYFTQPVTTTRTVQTQPGNTYGQVQQSQSANHQVQHWGYSQFDWVPSSRTAFRFLFHDRNYQGQNQFAASGTSTFNDTLVNGSTRRIRDETSLQNTGGSLSWRQQLGNNSGRLLSLSAELQKTKNVTNGYVYSLNSFFQPNGMPENTDTVDQRKQMVDQPLTINGELGLLEPLSPHVSLGLRYGFTSVANRPSQATFDRGEGKYQDLVDSLSNSLKTQQTIQRVTINLQGNMGKVRYTIDNDFIGYRYRQRDLSADSVLQFRFFYWAPRLTVSYSPNKTSYLSLKYFSYTQPPTADQLNPVRNNTNPLLITVGNPALRPSLNQDFRLELHRLKAWLLNLTADVMLTNNDISTKMTTDSLGRQISQPVNVDGAANASLNFSVSRRILGWDAGIHVRSLYTRSVNFLNADLNRNDAYTGVLGISLDTYVAGKFAIQANTNFGYFDQVSSINPSAPIRYLTQSHQGSLTFFFIPGFEINTNATYAWQQKTSSFSANTAVLLWNAYVSRNFMHDKLVLKFQFNNLLNANTGITRSNTANINTESATNILGRYWMVSAAWHFDRKFKRE